MTTTRIVTCILAAAAAGVVVGTLVTSPKGPELLKQLLSFAGKKLGGNLQDGLTGSEPAERRTEFDQASNPSSLG
jgi:hypothetical protein